MTYFPSGYPPGHPCRPPSEDYTGGSLNFAQFFQSDSAGLDATADNFVDGQPLDKFLGAASMGAQLQRGTTYWLWLIVAELSVGKHQNVTTPGAVNFDCFLRVYGPANQYGFGSRGETPYAPVSRPPFPDGASPWGYMHLASQSDIPTKRVLPVSPFPMKILIPNDAPDVNYGLGAHWVVHGAYGRDYIPYDFCLEGELKGV